VLVRTWNVFHGNTVPPHRQAHLPEMIELIAAGSPDAVCLQEVPPWAFGSLAAWSGMKAIAVRARRPCVGPLPVTAGLGRLLTAPHHGIVRSAFSGQGNAILIPPAATVRATKVITLNTNVFCEERGERLGLTPKQMRLWERERRICQLVQYELPNRLRFLVANLHATGFPGDPRPADAELRRAVSFVERTAELEETVVLAGDFNIAREQSETIRSLIEAPPESRYTDAGPSIDHVLVRGAAAATVRVWPDAEREYHGRLLSDHAPVEVEFTPARAAA
jgi:endonuclease/exonuclease/phosphatase family metal-dependent hydrolase